jgi:hypothetical protein
MSFSDVLIGHQTWSDYITACDISRVRVVTQHGQLVVTLDASDYELAVRAGIGALIEGIEVAEPYKASAVEAGLKDISITIEKFNADFHVLLGSVIWRLEQENETLRTILFTLQRPLDTQSRELRARAEDAYQNGWFDEAVADLLEAERKNYQDFSIHRTLGNIFFYNRIDLSRAYEYFLKAAKYAGPRDHRQAAEAKLWAGISRAVAQDFDTAIVRLEEAIVINSELYEASYILAACWSVMGKCDKAWASLKTAILGDPRYCNRVAVDPAFQPCRDSVEIRVGVLVGDAKEDCSRILEQLEENIRFLNFVDDELKEEVRSLVRTAREIDPNSLQDYSDVLECRSRLTELLNRQANLSLRYAPVDDIDLLEGIRTSMVIGAELDPPSATKRLKKNPRNAENGAVHSSLSSSGELVLVHYPTWSELIGYRPPCDAVLYHVPDFSVVAEWTVDYIPDHVIFGFNDDVVALQKSELLEIRETKTGDLVTEIELKSLGTDALAFSPNTEVLAVGGFGEGFSQVWLYKRDGTAIQKLPVLRMDESKYGRMFSRLDLRFSDDGLFLLARVRDTSQSKELDSTTAFLKAVLTEDHQQKLGSFRARGAQAREYRALLIQQQKEEQERLRIAEFEEDQQRQRALIEQRRENHLCEVCGERLGLIEWRLFGYSMCELHR